MIGWWLVVAAGLLFSQAKGQSRDVFRASTCRADVIQEKEGFIGKEVSLTIRGAADLIEKEDILRLLGARQSSATIDADGEVLTYEGRINAESVDRAKGLIRGMSALKRLRINSVGGSGDAAFELYEAVKKRGLDVEVFGVCISACAEFVIAAGKRLILNGPVLMHGNISSCIDRLGYMGLMRDFGVRNAIAFYATAKREEAVWGIYPGLRELSYLAANGSRGDPSGASHDYMDVCPAALRRAGLNVSLAPTYEERYRASFFLYTNAAVGGMSIYKHCGDR